MSSLILNISDLHVQLGSAKIINGVSLDVPQGESVGIIGPNGSGKTTLFNSLNGFVAATQGKILFEQQDITNVSAHARAKLGIARVFQNSGIFRDMTVEENMVIALESRSALYSPVFRWSKTYKNFIETSRRLLSEVKLETKLKEKAASLSGGQMRLLEITRALAFGAKLFLLDEPTAGVSPRMKDEVVTLVKKLKDLGKTVLIIEHDINLIERFCDRILVLDAGKIVMDGTPSEVRNNPALQEVYFGVGAQK
jgi:ABC-type branched-subunit amino acid transport system ATPase component